MRVYFVCLLVAGEGEGGMVGERGHRGSWWPGSAERERDVTMGGVWREMGGVGEGVRVGWRPSEEPSPLERGDQLVHPHIFLPPFTCVLYLCIIL